MMNNKSDKMTYVTALTYVLENAELPSEVAEKLEALKAQQVKRNSAEKKPTKTQVANEATKELVLEVLRECGEKLTVSELQTKHEELTAMSNQKVAALVRQLVKEGKVERLEEGRKAYFKA